MRHIGSRVLNTILIITLVSFAVRFINFSNISTFGHDTSRDLLLIYKLINFKEIIYRGPDFSVIWGFLSPIYYYILLIPVVITNYNPVTLPFLTMVLNALTVPVIFICTNKMYGPKAAFFASLIYAFSFQVIYEGGYGLNPAWLPYFSVLFVYSLYNVFIEKKYEYLMLLAFCYAILISFHISGIFLIFSAIGVYLVLQNNFDFKSAKNYLYKGAFIFIIVAVIPYAYQEKKFNYWNIKQIIKYFTTSESTKIDLITHVKAYTLITIGNIYKIISYEENILLYSFVIVVLVSLFILSVKFIKFKSPDGFIAFVVLVYLLSFGLLTRFDLTNNRQSWFYACIIPIIVIYIGQLFSNIYYIKFTKYFTRYFMRYFVFAALIVFVIENLSHVLTYTPKADNLSEVKKIADVIKTDSNGREYDIKGLTPQAYFYRLWFDEIDPVRKDWYFQKVNWNNSCKCQLVYLFVFKDNSQYTEKMDSVKSSYKVLNHNKIYSDIEVDLYRLD